MTWPFESHTHCSEKDTTGWGLPRALSSQGEVVILGCPSGLEWWRWVVTTEKPSQFHFGASWVNLFCFSVDCGYVQMLERHVTKIACCVESSSMLAALHRSFRRSCSHWIEPASLSEGFSGLCFSHTHTHTRTHMHSNTHVCVQPHTQAHTQAPCLRRCFFQAQGQGDAIEIAWPLTDTVCGWGGGQL